MRIAFLCTPNLLASAVSFVGCHGSMGGTSPKDSEGQGGIVVAGAGEGGATGDLGSGGTTGTVTPTTGGSTGVEHRG